MVNNITVSVIVPVYKVEKFLPQCIDSILEQTLSNIEVILVDDGSPDGCPAICDGYADRYDFVHVIHQENQGLGESRNNGIKVAKGEYLGFVDSDDYIEPNYYEVLYNAAKEKDADIVETETLDFDKNRAIPRVLSFESLKDITVTPETVESFFRDYYFASTYKHNAWDKIYRREFVVNNNIRFGDNKTIYAEDTWFQLQAIFYYPKIVFAKGTHYRYRLRLTSITHNTAKNLVQRESLMINMYDELLETDRKHRLVEKRACSVIAIEVLTLEALNQAHYGGCAKNFIEETKKISEEPVVRGYLESLYKTRAYDLEPKRGRRTFLKVVGLLFSLRLYGLAKRVIWGIYKAKEKQSVDKGALYN